MIPSSGCSAPLAGEWRHGGGVLCCGTLRIATADLDTDPAPNFQREVMDWICATLNVAQNLDFSDTERLSWLIRENAYGLLDPELVDEDQDIQVVVRERIDLCMRQRPSSVIGRSSPSNTKESEL